MEDREIKNELEILRNTVKDLLIKNEKLSNTIYSLKYKVEVLEKSNSVNVRYNNNQVNTPKI